MITDHLHLRIFLNWAFLSEHLFSSEHFYLSIYFHLSISIWARFWNWAFWPEQRYRIFFPGKVEGHSLTQIWRKLYFIFSQNAKKKNTAVFFFFLKKVQVHSLHFSGRNLLIFNLKCCIFSWYQFCGQANFHFHK